MEPGKVYKIYLLLLSAYKKQNWWPVTPEGKLLPEYSGGPKNEKQQLEVFIGAILTQNTSWKNVEKALVNLNKARLIDIAGLKRASQKKIASLIKSAGYFNQKAGRLKIISEFLSNCSIQKLQSTDISELRDLLLSIKGIGPETADSIILYAFNKPIFVIDAYTKRIFSRLGFLKEDTSYGEWQEFFHSNLANDAALFNEFHALIVEHAKRYCKKTPECSLCPLNKACMQHIKSFI